MDSDVFNKHGGAFEGFIAVWTLEWVLFGMGFNVHHQRRLGYETFFANFTLKLLFIQMGLLVHHQRATLGERLAWKKNQS